MTDTLSYISPFALSDGSDGPPFNNQARTATIGELSAPTLVSLCGKLEADDLPEVNKILRRNNARTIFALAPDQWLISESGMDGEPLIAELKIRYTGRTIVCVDHSHAWSLLRLNGIGAAKALSRLCPVDLYPKVFGKDSLIQTRMNGHYVLCTRTPDKENSFDLYIPHSYSRTFFEALRDAVVS